VLRFFIAYILFLWVICGSVGCKGVKHPSEVAEYQYELDELDDSETWIESFLRYAGRRAFDSLDDN
jgi:hypothetical protein